MRLRLNRDIDECDMPPESLPFPRQNTVPGRDAGADTDREMDQDAARMAEDALDRVQRGLDELDELVDSLPFPPVNSNDDDGPWAA